MTQPDYLQSMAGAGLTLGMDRFGIWHYLHVSRDVLPFLRSHGVTDDQIDAMLVRTPARILGG